MPLAFNAFILSTSSILKFYFHRQLHTQTYILVFDIHIVFFLNLCKIWLDSQKPTFCWTIFLRATFSQKNFLFLSLIALQCRLIIMQLNFYDVLRRYVKNSIYIRSESHSIVVVKCKHSSFSGRSPTGGMKKKISLCPLEKREHHISEWTLTKLANTFKIASKEKFLWSFIDFFCLLHT